METVLLGALDGDARPHDFGEAVDVVDLDAELVLEVLAELVGEGLGPVDARLEVWEVLLRPHLDRGVGDVHGIARGAADDGRPHGAQDVDLSLGIAG